MSERATSDIILLSVIAYNMDCSKKPQTYSKHNRTFHDAEMHCRQLNDAILHSGRTHKIK